MRVKDVVFAGRDFKVTGTEMATDARGRNRKYLALELWPATPSTNPATQP